MNPTHRLTLYMGVKFLAEPILEHWKTDLTVHDKRELSHFDKGDEAFWCARQCGTFLVRYAWKEAKDWGPAETLRYTRGGLEYLQACEATNPGLKWFRIEADSKRRGLIHPIRFEDAVSTVNDWIHYWSRKCHGRAA